MVHLALGPGPGYFLAGALAVTMAPFITDIADVEPVNILATMGIIGKQGGNGRWGVVELAMGLGLLHRSTTDGTAPTRLLPL